MGLPAPSVAKMGWIGVVNLWMSKTGKFRGVGE